MRLLFLTNIPSPYQVDFFTALAQRPEVSIHVIFCAASEHDRQFSVPEQFPFPATVLDSRRLPGTPKDWHRCPELGSVLDERLPIDLAILSGSYFMPAVRLARRYMIRRRIPWYYWGENPRKKGAIGFKGRLKQRLKERYLRWFLAPAAGAFGVGTLACDTFRQLVAAGRPVVNLPYAPNLDPLLSPSAETLQAAAGLRAAWPVADPIVVLFSGSLSHRKAPDLLLEAFAEAARAEPRLCLAYAGDGPLAPSLAAEVARRDLAGRVRFLGFVEGPALHAAYLAANLFVLPTRTHEGWGVVVQEALAAGLPAIVSDRVGCHADLVDGNGSIRVVPVGDSPRLADAILALARRSDRTSVSQHTRAVARAADARSSAARLAKTLTQAAPTGSIVPCPAPSVSESHSYADRSAEASHA